MINIKKLTNNDFSKCFELLSSQKYEKEYFKIIGWSLKEFKKQFLKNNNFALGLFYQDFLEGFIFGDLIFINNIIEYEILLLYVNKKKRKLGYATNLLQNIEVMQNTNKLKKIYLEVSSKNKKAISLYNKNGYRKSGIRKNYYKVLNSLEDAYLLEKEINDK